MIVTWMHGGTALPGLKKSDKRRRADLGLVVSFISCVSNR